MLNSAPLKPGDTSAINETQKDLLRRVLRLVVSGWSRSWLCALQEGVSAHFKHRFKPYSRLKLSSSLPWVVPAASLCANFKLTSVCYPIMSKFIFKTFIISNFWSFTFKDKWFNHRTQQVILQHRMTWHITERVGGMKPSIPFFCKTPQQIHLATGP